MSTCDLQNSMSQLTTDSYSSAIFNVSDNFWLWIILNFIETKLIRNEYNSDADICFGVYKFCLPQLYQYFIFYFVRDNLIF